jgi:hypothetical protein
MTNSLPRTTLYENFESTTELANLHIHKLDAAGFHLSETRHPAYDSLKPQAEPSNFTSTRKRGMVFLSVRTGSNALTRMVQWFETHLK